MRQFERQPWETPEHDEILLVRNFGGAETITVPHEPGGHFGGDVLDELVVRLAERGRRVALEERDYLREIGHCRECLAEVRTASG